MPEGVGRAVDSALPEQTGWDFFLLLFILVISFSFLGLRRSSADRSSDNEQPPRRGRRGGRDTIDRHPKIPD